ncbi:MAG TPA: hypothetical protein ENJ19_05930 [Gammaproteobacteria bacterium]|nr:hypothetical protein [Gammaproteobacteria bacterium]
MTDPRHYLALDQGGHASRALVFSERGEIVAAAKRPLATHRLNDGRVEHDPEEIIASCRDVLEEVAVAPPVTTAGLATQRSSIVCWDRSSGAALSPVISWQDCRNHQWLQGCAGGHTHFIHQHTGLFLSPHYGAGKLRWCWDHLPEVRQAHTENRLAWGPLASFILYRLSREHSHCIDPANAARTLLWNPRRRDWDAGLLALFGLPPQPLPQCVPNRHAFGHLDLNGHPVPITLLTGDQNAALFAFGRPRPETVYINLGTGAFLQRPMEEWRVVEGLLSGLAYADDGFALYTLEGTVNGAGSALSWLAGEEGIGDTEATAQLDAWLAATPAPPLFLNGIGGLGTPFLQPRFPSRFTAHADRPRRFTALVESIVFLIQANLEAMAKALPNPPRQLVLSGGLSQSAGLCQRLADLSGLPLSRATVAEATAAGLARLLTTHAGRCRWREMTGDTFTPNTNAALKQRYKAWSSAMIQSLS